jgi:hypothetical protein
VRWWRWALARRRRCCPARRLLVRAPVEVVEAGTGTPLTLLPSSTPARSSAGSAAPARGGSNAVLRIGATAHRAGGWRVGGRRGSPHARRTPVRRLTSTAGRREAPAWDGSTSSAATRTGARRTGGRKGSSGRLGEAWVRLGRGSGEAGIGSVRGSTYESDVRTSSHAFAVQLQSNSTSGSSSSRASASASARSCSASLLVMIGPITCCIPGTRTAVAGGDCARAQSPVHGEAAKAGRVSRERANRYKHT